jgi:YD repeat-containing protein
VYRSTGSGFAAGIATGIPASETYTLRSIDLDGNGLSDIGYEASGSWRVRPFNGAFPDLLTRATDGFGNFVSPSYAPLTNSTIYTKESGAVPPLAEVQAPLYVVGSYQSNSGIASPDTYTVSYKYQGARVHAQGRGFVGFAKRTRTDNRPGNQLGTVEFYRQDFPYIGNLASSTVYQPNGVTKISEINNTYEAKVLDASAGNTRLLPYTRSVTERKYEVGGPNNGELITSSTTTTSIDNYGNVTLQEVAAVDEFLGSPLKGSVYRSFSDNTYVPNTTTWCLGVVQTARVKSQPAGASTPTTRTKSFVVDEGKCRATQEQIEPGDTTLQVTTTFAYHPSGHASAGQISSRTVTGINMQPRVTSYEYHPAGPLVTKTTDALGHTNSSEWNAGLEFETAHIDLNGKRIEYGSDSIGRKTSELRPDGTRVDIRYFACTTGCGLATGKFQLVTTSSAQGSIIEQGATIYDALGRVIQSTDWLLGGVQAHVLTEYDMMGRVARKSAPLFTGAPIYWATTSYDLIGRPLSEQRPVSETDSSMQTLTWSHEGLRMRQTDANSKVIIQRTDATGRIVQMTDAAGTHTWYEYNRGDDHHQSVRLAWPQEAFG